MLEGIRASVKPLVQYQIPTLPEKKKKVSYPCSKRNEDFRITVHSTSAAYLYAPGRVGVNETPSSLHLHCTPMMMAIQSTLEMCHLAESGVYLILVTFGVGLLFGLIVLTSDYLDGWLRRRALGDIPLVDEGSNMSACLRWWSRKFDCEKEYAEAYKQVSECQNSPLTFPTQYHLTHVQYSKTGKPYATRLKNNDHGIVLPLNSTKEWRTLPHDQLSFLHALSEVNT